MSSLRREALEKFLLLKPKLDEYWDRPETREFIGTYDENPPDRDDDWVEQMHGVGHRKEIVHDIVFRPEESKKIQAMLLSSNYNAVLKYHQRLFDEEEWWRGHLRSDLDYQ